MRMLRLTNDQYDVLYDLLEETICDIEHHIEDTDIEIDDYEIYQVWKQLNNYGGKNDA